MNDHILHAFGINLMVAELVVKDLTAEQMTVQPHGLINHPAWSLAHLVRAIHVGSGFAGVEVSLPDGWFEKFSGDVPPNPDPAQNPPKDELLARLRAGHERVKEALPTIAPETFAKRHPDDTWRKLFPTVGDHFYFMMTAHEMDHVGQMAAWRRAMGMKPAM